MSSTPQPPTPDEGNRWFDAYMDVLENHSVIGTAENGPYACPCCGYITLAERSGFEICSVCFWEDDGQDDHDADLVRGGPNGAISLTDARRNFAEFGACDERSIQHVRPPHPDEIPAEGSARPLPGEATRKRRGQLSP